MTVKVLVVLSLFAMASASPTLRLPLPTIQLGGTLSIGSSDLGVGLGSLLKTIIGSKHTARKSLTTILAMKIKDWNSFCDFSTQIVVSLCDTIEASYRGLGILISRVIICLLRIIICFLGNGGNNPICSNNINSLVGVSVTGAANAQALIKSYGLLNVQANLNAIINLYTKGLGISRCKGSPKYIFQAALDLVNILQIIISGSGQLTKDHLSLCFRKITLIIGVIGNSRKNGLGITIVKNYLAACNKYLKIAGYKEIDDTDKLATAIDSCNDDNGPWKVSDVDDDQSTSVNVCVSIGGLLKGLLGVTRLAANLIKDILSLVIRSAEDVFTLIIKIVLALGGILDATCAGLGSLLVRIVAGLLKIHLCFLGTSKYGVCKPDWDRQFQVFGVVTNIDLVIKLYGLSNCRSQVDGYISTYVKKRGNPTGSVKVLMDTCVTLSDICDSRKWDKTVVVTVFKHVTTCLGAVGNSNSKGVGTSICNKFVPTCNKYLEEYKVDVDTPTVDSCNDDDNTWTSDIDTSDGKTGWIIGGNGGVSVGGDGGGGVIGGIIKGIFGTIKGVTKLVGGVLDTLLTIKINVLKDVFTFILNLVLVLQVTLNNLANGLGSLFARIVACIIKIAICVKGYPGDKGICTKDWNKNFGILTDGSSTAELIVAFKLTNVLEEFNGHVNKCTGGKGISSTKGSIRTVLEKIRILIDIILNADKISKNSVTDCFVHIITICGSIGNSKKRDSGKEITREIVPKCGKCFKEAGYVDITVTITMIESECEKSNDDNCNWNGGDNTTPSPGGETTPSPGGKTTPAPGGKTTPSPGGKTTPSPGGKTTPSPGGKTTPSPGGKTTPSPGGKTTPSPGGETTPSPGGKTTPSPGGKTTPSPGGKTTPSPGGKTTPSPGGETTPSPGGKTTPSPGGKTTPSHGGKTTPSPGGKTTPSPGGKTTPSHGGKTTPSPGGKTTPSPGGKTTPSHGGKTTPSPGGKTTPSPGGKTTPSHGGKTTPSPGGKTTSSPGGKTTPSHGGKTTPSPGGKTTPSPGGDTTPSPGGHTTPSGYATTAGDTGTTPEDTTGTTPGDTTGTTPSDTTGATPGDTTGTTPTPVDTTTPTPGGDTSGDECGTIIGGAIKDIPGCTKLSTTILIKQIYEIRIRSIIDIVNLTCKLTLGLGGIIDLFVTGLGSIFTRIVAVIYKIGCCVHGWGDKSVCTKEWNAPFGVTGDASTHKNIIGLYRLQNCKSEVNTIINKYTEGKDISKENTVISVILQHITSLVDIVSSETITKEHWSTCFIHVFSILGCITNSYSKGSGTVIIQKVIPICGPYFVKQGCPDIREEKTRVVTTITVGNNAKIDWNTIRTKSNSGDLSTDVKDAFKGVKDSKDKASYNAVFNLEIPRNFDGCLSFVVKVIQAMGAILDLFISGLGSLLVRIVGCLINYIIAILGGTRHANSFVCQKAYYDSFSVKVTGSSWSDLVSGFGIANCQSDLDGIKANYIKNKGSLNVVVKLFLDCGSRLTAIVAKGPKIVEEDLSEIITIVSTMFCGFANSCTPKLGQKICDSFLPVCSSYLEQKNYPAITGKAVDINKSISVCNNVAVPWVAKTTVVEN